MKSKLVPIITLTGIVFFAFVFSILAVSAPKTYLPIIIHIRYFFEIMIPIVSTGGYILLILFLIHKW